MLRRAARGLSDAQVMYPIMPGESFAISCDSFGKVAAYDPIGCPGFPGEFGLSRAHAQRCCHTWFYATGSVDCRSSSSSLGVRMPSAE